MDTNDVADDTRTVEGGDDPLTRLRERIDAVDERIVEALATRYRLAQQVGRLKGLRALPPLDPGREAGIVRRASAAARREGVPEEGVRRLFWSLLALCRDGVLDASRFGSASEAAPATDTAPKGPEATDG